MNLSTSAVGDILKIFLDVEKNPGKSKMAATAFLNSLRGIEEFFERQTTYHVYASSLLFVYDGAFLQNLDLNQSKSEDWVRLKMIDFAHVFPANGAKDENFIFGLKNLLKIFIDFLNK